MSRSWFLHQATLDMLDPHQWAQIQKEPPLKDRYIEPDRTCQGMVCHAFMHLRIYTRFPLHCAGQLGLGMCNLIKHFAHQMMRLITSHCQSNHTFHLAVQKLGISQFVILPSIPIAESQKSLVEEFQRVHESWQIMANYTKIIQQNLSPTLPGHVSKALIPVHGGSTLDPSITGPYLWAAVMLWELLPPLHPLLLVLQKCYQPSPGPQNQTKKKWENTKLHKTHRTSHRP